MAVPISEALAAYRQSSAALAHGMEARPDEGKSFAELLGRAGADAVAVGHTAEKMTAAAIAGKADLSSVIAAVANAELTLQTVVAVRDRMVQAYQEVMRMPI